MPGRETPEFETLIDRWTADAVRASGTTYARFIRSLPGVYPSVARDALRRLGRRGSVPRGVIARIIAEAAGEEIVDVSFGTASDLLPVPHPLDYEWRYAEGAVTRILDAWDENSRAPGGLLLLGAPSVAARAVRLRPHRAVAALDVNATVVTALRREHPLVLAELCDLTRDELPRVPPASTVVCDPPWYPEDLHAFLWAGCKLSQPRARVLVSLPPLGTRPGMEEERGRLITYATGLGLDLVRVTLGALPYVSPPFERNALRADGLSGTPLDWRRGDLAEFVWLGGELGPRPPVTVREDGWGEVSVEGIRIRVRNQIERGFFDPSFIPIVAGDVLPTVSRRDPRRRLASVWTAGNRVFGCRGPGILAQVLRAVSTGEDPVRRVEAAIGRVMPRREIEQVRRAVLQINELVQTEQDEQASWEEQCRREGLRAVAV